MAHATPLKLAREKAGRTQRSVAIELGVTERTMSCWETGKNPPPGDMLIKLARIYNRRPEDLLRIA